MRESLRSRCGLGALAGVYKGERGCSAHSANRKLTRRHSQALRLVGAAGDLDAGDLDAGDLAGGASAFGADVLCALAGSEAVYPLVALSHFVSAAAPLAAAAVAVAVAAMGEGALCHALQPMATRRQAEAEAEAVASLCRRASTHTHTHTHTHLGVALALLSLCLQSLCHRSATSLCPRPPQARTGAVGARGAARCGAPPRGRLARRGDTLGGGALRGGAAQPDRPRRPRRRRHRRLRCEWRQPGGTRARQPGDHLWRHLAAWCGGPRETARTLVGGARPPPLLLLYFSL